MKKSIELIDGSKLNVNTIPSKELKKAGLAWRKKHTIWKELDRLEKQNMRKYHCTIQTSAIFEWIYDRCVINTIKDGWILIYLKDYKKMKNKYSKNKVHSPYDLGVEEIPCLLRMFMEGSVSEC